MTRRSRTARAVTVASLIGIAFFTLGPGEPDGTTAPFHCLRCGSFWLTDLIANLALFMPFGVAAAACRFRTRHVMITGLIVSVAIEAWQYFGSTGRDATLSDVLANTLGSLLGALGAPLLLASLTPRPARARRLLILGAVAVVAIAATASRLLLPTRPTAPLFLQIEPENEGPETIPSRVARVILDHQHILDEGRLAESVGVRGALRDRRFVLEATVNPAPTLPGYTTLVRVTPPIVASIGEVGITAQSWSGAIGLRAEDFGMRGLSLSSPREERSGDPVRLSVERDGALLRLRAVSGTGVSERVLVLSVLELWVPFMPFHTVAGDSLMPMSVALAILVPAVFGWWAGLARTPQSVGIAIGAVTLAAVCPTITAALAPPPAWAWILASGSILCGWEAGRRRSRHQSDSV